MNPLLLRTSKHGAFDGLVSMILCIGKLIKYVKYTLINYACNYTLIFVRYLFFYIVLCSIIKHTILKLILYRCIGFCEGYVVLLRTNLLKDFFLPLYITEFSFFFSVFRICNRWIEYRLTSCPPLAVYSYWLICTVFFI